MASTKKQPVDEQPEEVAPSVDPNNPSEYISFIKAGPSQDDLNPAYAPPKDEGQDDSGK